MLRSKARGEADQWSTLGAPGIRPNLRAQKPLNPKPKMGATLPARPGESSTPAAGMPSGGTQRPTHKAEVKGITPSNKEGVVKRQPREVPRWYSVSSQGALSQLAAVEMEVLSVQHRVEELAALPLDTEEQRGQARTELAQLEAEAHKLECQGVDNVYTGDLDSGKAEAKDLKKALLSRLETILERIEIFRRLKMPSSP